MPGTSKKGGGLKTKKYPTGAKFGGGASTAKKISKLPAGMKKKKTATKKYPTGAKFGGGAKTAKKITKVPARMKKK
jgi:hypothetical protein